MQKKFIDGDYTPEQMKALLTEHCTSMEEGNYFIDLSEEDLAERKHDLSENVVKLTDLKAELKEVTAEFRNQMKPLEVTQGDLLKQIRTRKQEINGNLYHIANHDNGMMETFTQDGNLYSSRRLRPDEKQGRVNFLNAVNQ